VEDMVTPAIAGGALDGNNVLGLCDHTHQARVPARVRAHAAGVGLGEVPAQTTKADALAQLHDRGRQGLCLLRGGAQDVEGQPSPGLLSYPR
jgi:hypothetical protein